jgi:hypothetical protein
MDITIRPEKLNDWLLARWALLRLMDLRAALPEEADLLEASFTPGVLRALLGRASVEDRIFVLRAVSPRRFEPFADELAEQFPAHPRALGWRMAETAAAIAPERLVAALEQFLARHRLEDELTSLTGLAATLLALPEGHGREPATVLADFVLGFGDENLLDLLRPELIELTRRHQRPRRFRALLEHLFAASRANHHIHTDAILHSYEALTDGLPYYSMLRRRVLGEGYQTLVPLRPLFASGAPLAELDALAAEEAPVVLERIGALLPEAGAQEAPAAAARELLESAGSVREEGRPALALFLVALAAAAHARQKPDWTALGASEVAALAIADIEQLPDEAGALARLRALPRIEAAEALEAALLENEESAGAVTVARLMGQLGTSELLRPLRASLDSILNTRLADQAAESLCRFGAAAELTLVPRWEELTEAQQDYGAWMLSLIGGEATVRLLLERRADLLDEEARARWISMALGLPDPRLLELLEAERGPEPELDLDEAYVMQRLLLDREGPDLEVVRRRVLEDVLEKDWQEDEEANGPPPLVLELRCRNCGAVEAYEDPPVYVDWERPADLPLVDGDHACSRCEEPGHLEPTDEGLEALRVQAEAIAAHGWDSEALQSLTAQLEDGREVPIGVAIAHYEHALSERPESVVDLYMLARCWRSAGYTGRAAELYRRSLEAEPAYVQSAVDLADLLGDEQRTLEGLAVLDGALAHQARWQLFRNVEHATRAGLNRAVAGLYNELLDRAGDTGRARLRVSDLSAERAGRNDPCPCGSGKKYKKCCLAKSQ